MKINTKYHGEKDIQEKDLLFFANGLPGFEEEKQFVLLDFPDNHVFFALQSVQTPELSFVVTDPFSFFIDYKIELDDATVKTLDIEQPDDVTLLLVLTVQEPFDQTTANLQAPIVINKQDKKARQIILTGTPYETRHSLFPAAAAKGE